MNNTPISELEREKIERIVAHGIKSVVYDSGPIQKQDIGRVSLVVSSNLMDHLKQITISSIETGLLQQKENELKEYKRKYNKISKAHNKLAEKLGLKT